jgi:transcription antitermination protein NusB
MQTLYSVESQDGLIPAGEPQKLLQKHFEQSRQLLSFLVYSLTEIARYAETDARQRASKHLPTQQDLAVNIKISGNEILWKIIEHPSFQQSLKSDKPQLTGDAELFKKLYQELAASELYQSYISAEGRNRKDETGILEYIFNNVMLPSDLYTSFVEERFSNWDDDADTMKSIIAGYLSKPASLNLQEFIGADKWEFARLLLDTTMSKKEVALDLIRPKLKNWEPDRIAVLDMLLMRMGVCEFLYFETIPPKVTINEYIDLAKDYSTQQSGQFVNGILDNIHKDLVKENKMHKVSFKPS